MVQLQKDVIIWKIDGRSFVTFDREWDMRSTMWMISREKFQVYNTIADTEKNKSGVETDQDHTYVDISAFGLDNVPYPSYTNNWEEFVWEPDFDEISAIAAHDKPWKVISAKHLGKVWRINMESAQKTLNVTTQRL